jgi:hypothetical protein
MHLTKDLYVNLLGFMGVYEKYKDTLELRHPVYERMREPASKEGR